MVAIVYQCPNTGFSVQGYTAEQEIPAQQDRYESVTCLACKQVHLVNVRTGEVFVQTQLDGHRTV